MMSEWSMTPNHALHRTLNQRRFTCWLSVAERWPLGVQKRTNQGLSLPPWWRLVTDREPSLVLFSPGGAVAVLSRGWNVDLDSPTQLNQLPPS
jgi:hypothetical protein